MQFSVAVLPGDGVGPEVTSEAIKVLQVIGNKFGHSLSLHYGLVGGCAIDQQGTALSPDTLKMCKSCGAVLLGMARRAHGAHLYMGRGSRTQSLDTVMVGWRALPAHALVEFELRHRLGGTRGVDLVTERYLLPHQIVTEIWEVWDGRWYQRAGEVGVSGSAPSAV